VQEINSRKVAQIENMRLYLEKPLWNNVEVQRDKRDEMSSKRCGIMECGSGVVLPFSIFFANDNSKLLLFAYYWRTNFFPSFQ
jgi:hypothetical protein